MFASTFPLQLPKCSLSTSKIGANTIDGDFLWLSLSPMMLHSWQGHDEDQLWWQAPSTHPVDKGAYCQVAAVCPVVQRRWLNPFGFPFQNRPNEMQSGCPQLQWLAMIAIKRDLFTITRSICISLTSLSSMFWRITSPPPATNPFSLTAMNSCSLTKRRGMRSQRFGTDEEDARHVQAQHNFLQYLYLGGGALRTCLNSIAEGVGVGGNTFSATGTSSPIFSLLARTIHSSIPPKLAYSLLLHLLSPSNRIIPGCNGVGVCDSGC